MADEKVKKRRREVDWVALRARYVCGYINSEGEHVFPTYRELAEEEGLAHYTVVTHASKENWGVDRKQYKDDLEQSKREKRIENLSDQAVDFDVRVIKTAKAGMAHIEAHMRVAKKHYEDTGRPMDAKKLELLSRALERYQKVGRLALGETTHNVHSTHETWLDLYAAIEE